MNVTGPIIVIEDDLDDQMLLKEAFEKINYPNTIICFEDGGEALAYLNATAIEPFIIFSDINMPKLNGMELRAQIHQNENLRLKTTPYLFFTTSAAQKHVIEAYSKSIQGFFVKPATFKELQVLLRIIVDYWQNCISPDYKEK